jgi:hypothetical protein
MTMQTDNKSNFTKEMHSFVWVFTVIFSLCAITFPIAFWRVAQTEKFKGSHVKSYPVGERSPQIADKKP